VARIDIRWQLKKRVHNACAFQSREMKPDLRVPIDDQNMKLGRKISHTPNGPILAAYNRSQQTLAALEGETRCPEKNPSGIKSTRASIRISPGCGIAL